MVLCVELSALVLGEPAERAANRRHAPNGRAHGGRDLKRYRRRSRHSWNPGHRPVLQHAADVSHQRIPAARVAAEHGDQLQYERLRGRRHADMGQRAPHDENGTRLALGTAERDPASVANRIVHVQRARQRPPWRGQHGHTARELPARAGAELLDRCAAVGNPAAGALPGVLHPG